MTIILFLKGAATNSNAIIWETNFFSEFSAQFIKSISNFKYFEEKKGWPSLTYVFPKLEAAKDVVS